jgi:hypothetical protein
VKKGGFLLSWPECWKTRILSSTTRKAVARSTGREPLERTMSCPDQCRTIFYSVTAVRIARPCQKHHGPLRNGTNQPKDKSCVFAILLPRCSCYPSCAVATFSSPPKHTLIVPLLLAESHVPLNVAKETRTSPHAGVSSSFAPIAQRHPQDHVIRSHLELGQRQSRRLRGTSSRTSRPVTRFRHRVSAT